MIRKGPRSAFGRLWFLDDMFYKTMNFRAMKSHPLPKKTKKEGKLWTGNQRSVGNEGYILNVVNIEYAVLLYVHACKGEKVMCRKSERDNSCILKNR